MHYYYHHHHHHSKCLSAQSRRHENWKIKTKCQWLRRRFIRWPRWFGRRPHSLSGEPRTGVGTGILFPCVFCHCGNSPAYLSYYYYYYYYYHRQRGSDCTVLTATGLVNGEWQILTPYRIETPKPIDKKILLITSARRRRIPNLVKIRPQGASGQIGEI